MPKARTATPTRAIASVWSNAPVASMAMPNAATGGQCEPSGTCTGLGGTSGTGVMPLGVHLGRRLETVGMTLKLYTGGGDGMAHSSVAPFHGSLPAISPCFRVRQTLYMKIRNPITRNTVPYVDAWLYGVTPRSGVYV